MINTPVATSVSCISQLYSLLPKKCKHYVAKVFEREINLSIVHWIRQNLGVQLPNYFNRHQQNVDAIFIHDGRQVDFNRSGPNYRWNPPAMGESQIAYRQVAGNMNDWLEQPRDFLNQWDEIRQVRNQAAHTEFVGQNSVSQIQQALNQLADNNIFQILSNMKITAKRNGFQLNP